MSKALEEIANTGEYMKDITRFMCLDEVDGVLSEPDAEPITFSTLEFRNVRFKYPNSTDYIIDGLNFTLENGYHYAFVGKNGAGKTTTIKLIMGLYSEYEGEILINNKELHEYSAGAIKAMFLAVHQDFAQYNISMKDNITLGNIGAIHSNEYICEVAGLVGLNETIAALKSGIDTPLGKIQKDGQDIRFNYSNGFHAESF